MNFGNTFQEFCEINQLTKQEAIRILEDKLRIREVDYVTKHRFYRQL